MFGGLFRVHRVSNASGEQYSITVRAKYSSNVQKTKTKKTQTTEIYAYTSNKSVKHYIQKSNNTNSTI